MNGDTITLSKTEYEALLDRLEDAEDFAALAEHRADVAARGWDAVEADCLPWESVKRLLDGEHPLRVWRKHRGMTGQQLEAASGVLKSYISEIECGKKPGSVDALGKLSKALGLKIEDLVQD